MVRTVKESRVEAVEAVDRVRWWWRRSCGRSGWLGTERSGLLPPLWDHHEMQGFPDQLLIGLVIATLPLSLAA